MEMDPDAVAGRQAAGSIPTEGMGESITKEVHHPESHAPFFPKQVIGAGLLTKGGVNEDTFLPKQFPSLFCFIRNFFPLKGQLFRISPGADPDVPVLRRGGHRGPPGPRGHGQGRPPAQGPRAGAREMLVYSIVCIARDKYV